MRLTEFIGFYLMLEIYFLWQNTLPFRTEMNASPVGRLRRPEGENINPKGQGFL